MKTTEYRLGDVCTIRNGYAFKSENFTKEGVSVIRISNINDGTATVDGALKTHDSRLFDHFTIKKGDILIAMSGATTGKFGRYISNEKAYQNQRVGCFVVKDQTKLNVDYLYVLLRGLQDKIEIDAYGGGQPNISPAIIENYKIRLPSLHNQIQLANILKKAENLIKSREESISLCETFINNLFLKSQSEPKKPHKFSDIIEIQSGLVNPNILPYTKMFHVGAANIESNSGLLTKLNLAEDENLKSGKFHFTDKHILYSKIRPYLNKVATPDFNGICSADIYPILANYKKTNRFYIKHVLKSNDFLSYAIANSGRANIPKVNRETMLNYIAKLPNKSIQDIFENRALQVESLKKAFEQSLNSFKNLSGSISQKALAGNLEIREIKSSNKVIDHLSIPVSSEKVIEKINQELQVYHLNQAHSGAPDEIDNTLRQLEAELLMRGEIPFWDEYVKYKIVRVKFKQSFTFEALWAEITKFPFESLPSYDKVCNMVFKWLTEENAFIRQHFNTTTKQIELAINETAQT